MRLIQPSFEILEQGPGIQGIYKQIELAGRTCYKSLDKITEDSAEGFVNRMIASQHHAMLEHGTVYLRIPVNIDVAGDFLDDVSTWTKCKLVEEESGNWWAVTTNYRRIIELKYQSHLKYLCEPTEFHEKRVTVRFTTDRGVSHEFVRHRVFSFAQESTRYCNYSKDKFGKELTFITPSWSLAPMSSEDFCGDYFLTALHTAEYNYLYLVEHGWSPQQARQVLPNAIKTELVMTGFVSDWQHFFDLRARGTTGAPHPDAKALAEPLMHEFENRGLI